MTHKMHECPTEGGKAWVEAAKATYGWPYDKVALNVTMSKRTGELKHETCPWGCGTDHTAMEDVPPQDQQLLEVNPRASGYLRQPQATTKAQNAELMKALKTQSDQIANLTKEIAKLKKGGSN